MPLKFAFRDPAGHDIQAAGNSCCCATTTPASTCVRKHNVVNQALRSFKNRDPHSAIRSLSIRCAVVDLGQSERSLLLELGFTVDLRRRSQTGPRSVDKKPPLSCLPGTSTHSNRWMRDFKILSARFRKIECGAAIVRLLLGENDGTAPITVVPNATVFNSFLPGAVPLGKNLETESVVIRRLDSLLPENRRSTGVSRIFLKMDTQGYDLKCFAGASGGIHQILGLLSELSVQPVYQGMPHYLKSLRQYEAVGFQLVSLTEVSRRNGAVQELDCLMRKSVT